MKTSALPRFLCRHLKPTPVATRRGESGGTRVAVIVLVFALGLAVGAFSIYQAVGSRHGAPNANPASPLSAGTISVLQDLNSPIELRFYSLLPDAAVNKSLSPLSQRVDQLLAAFEQAASGNLHIMRINDATDANMKAADADGIVPFNLSKGDACYLGIAVGRGSQKTALPQLAGEWEPALEFDLTRAILKISQGEATPAAAAPAMADVSPAATEAVKALIPHPESVSVEDATRIVRAASVKEFQEAVAQMEPEIKAAQAKFEALMKGEHSEADQQAALKQLQELQATQTEKLKAIAAKAEAQIAAFKQLKTP